MHSGVKCGKALIQEVSGQFLGMLTRIMLNSFHIGQHLRKLPARDVSREFQCPNLVGAHLLGVTLRALADHLKVAQELFRLDHLAQTSPARHPVGWPGSILGRFGLFQTAISHLHQPRVNGLSRYTEDGETCSFVAISFGGVPAFSIRRASAR